MKYLITLFVIVGTFVMVAPSFAVSPEELKALCENTSEKTDVTAALASLKDGEKVTIGGVTYKKVGNIVTVE